jgi:hypothetical protein
MRNLIIIFLLGLCFGLLIGLRQQHKQKDYMIKMLMATPVQVSSSDSVPNLPKIEELK